MSKDLRGEGKDGISPGKKNPKQPGKEDGEETGLSQGEVKPEAPQLATLLEFVAWLALQWREETKAEAESLTRRTSGMGWVTGRGGFLADDLDALQEASIRLQVCSASASFLLSDPLWATLLWSVPDFDRRF